LTYDPGDEPSTTPKLNCGAFEKPVGLFDSFAVVSASEAPVPNKMVTSDEIGPVIWHGAAPLYWAGAQYSQSPIKAEGMAVMGGANTLYVRWSIKFKRGHFTFSKGTNHLSE
jgi:hypothetical protein